MLGRFTAWWPCPDVCDGGRRGRMDQASPFIEIHVGCEFRYETAPAVEFVIQVEPPAEAGSARRLSAERSVEPAVPLRDYVDGFGNHCWRLTAPGGPLVFRYDASYLAPDLPDGAVAVPQTPVAALPDATLVYTLPSRFCQSDLLLDEAWRLFGDGPEGFARVQAICDWVHANIAYDSAAADPLASAVDTYERRWGVCRDFAHLPVAFCRALNIPARYVFGYLPDYRVIPPDVPMDFHAWFEAFLDGRWHTFDARHNIPRTGRVRIAQGRDAVDVAMVTSYGNAQLQTMTVWSDATPITADRDIRV